MLDFRVVGAPYMNAACVAMTKVAPGVCLSPAASVPVVSGHCKSTCVYTESRDLDAEAPGFAMNHLLYCHFFVLSKTSLLHLYRKDSEDISAKMFISGAWQLLWL